MDVSTLTARLSPDIERTVRRFAFALILGAFATLVLLGLINDWAGPVHEDTGIRLLGGLAIAAIAAAAGQLFGESRPERRIAGMILTYAVPLALFLLFQLDDSRYLFGPPLLPALIMWLSVAAFLPRAGQERARQQDMFWWLNHRAAASGAIALIAFLIIAVGTIAIERSLAILFGLQTDALFYNYILPVVGGFLVPAYWLATLPTIEQYDEQDLAEPDFISRAVGFLGQFILVPLLLAYVLILYAYALQIVLTGSLPQGTLGWMVLAFTVTGAATVLVLHPVFMRERLIVRLFRAWWFWLTLVPILLFTLAVFIRVDAYGLTPQRVLLIYGGLWAALLSLLFLIPRTADIRWIPALGGLFLLLAAAGPLNVDNLSNWSQAARLSDTLSAAGFTAGEAPDWTPEQAQTARGGLEYLATSSDWRAQQQLQNILNEHGVDIPAGRTDIAAIAEQLHLPPASAAAGTYVSAYRDTGIPADVGGTPLYLGAVYASAAEIPSISGPLNLRLSGTELLLHDAEGETVQTRVALDPLLQTDSSGQPTDLPSLDFNIDGVRYRIIVESVGWRISEAGEVSADHLSGQLFADRGPPRPSLEDPPTPGTS